MSEQRDRAGEAHSISVKFGAMRAACDVPQHSSVDTQTKELEVIEKERS